MSIQYTLLGFKPTTVETRVSSHNHWTRTPTCSNVLENYTYQTWFPVVGNFLTQAATLLPFV